MLINLYGLHLYTSSLKYDLKGCGWFGHKDFTSKNGYCHLYQKKAPKNTSFPGQMSTSTDPKFDIHPNGTRRGFPPLIL